MTVEERISRLQASNQRLRLLIAKMEQVVRTGNLDEVVLAQIMKELDEASNELTVEERISKGENR